MRSQILFTLFTFICCVFASKYNMYAQSSFCVDGINQFTGEICTNQLKPGVPFLRFAPNAKSISMGGSGMAIEPDPTSISLNSSNLVFSEAQFEIAHTYIPSIDNDLLGNASLHHAGVYFKINDQNVIAASVRYFDIGFAEFFSLPNVENNHIFELEGLISYNRRLGKHFAMGLSMKYIQSSALIDRPLFSGEEFIPAKTIAGDFSFTYNKPLKLGNKTGKWITGLAISNIGTKIHYQEIKDPKWASFLPTNLGLGTGYSMELAKNHSFTLAFDLNRLLIPTPSQINESGRADLPDYKEKSAWQGMWTSFGDAPNGFTEEWQENQYSFGLEYRYKVFYIRHGYFIEHKTKGNRKFMGNGIGIRLLGFGLDLAYSISLNDIAVQETYRITISSDFGTKD